MGKINRQLSFKVPFLFNGIEIEQLIVRYYLIVRNTARRLLPN